MLDTARFPHIVNATRQSGLAQMIDAQQSLEWRCPDDGERQRLADAGRPVEGWTTCSTKVRCEKLERHLVE